MTTKDLGISLHEELDRREKLLAQLTTECDALRTVLGVLERPTPEQHNLVTRVIGHRGRKKKASTPPQTRRATDSAKPQVSTNGRCKKHPDVHLGPSGRCSECQREYYQKWAKKKKAEKPNGHAVEPSSPAVPSAKPLMVKCDACGDRFPDAKTMGIHKTRVHFSTNSERRSTLD